MKKAFCKMCATICGRFCSVFKQALKLIREILEICVYNG
ncbi:DUF6783 domain-containing protein [uncultured Clostridium sp.]